MDRSLSISLMTPGDVAQHCEQPDNSIQQPAGAAE
jgi:hypothetical protein